MRKRVIHFFRLSRNHSFIHSLHDHSTIPSYDKGRPIGRELTPDIIHNSFIIDDIFTHIENLAINVFKNDDYNT